MAIAKYILITIVVAPVLFFAFLFGLLWKEELEEKSITEHLYSSELNIEDESYYCLEAKCFGNFVLPENHIIDFFVVKENLDKVISDSYKIREDWKNAEALCNEITEESGKQVCQLGGKIIRHSSCPAQLQNLTKWSNSLRPQKAWPPLGRSYLAPLTKIVRN